MRAPHGHAPPGKEYGVVSSAGVIAGFETDELGHEYRGKRPP